MQWSKLKSIIESRFADSVKSKVQLHTTHYDGCGCGRGWITYKGEQIANFETLLNLRRIHGQNEPTNEFGHLVVDENRLPNETMSRGEFNRWDLHQACWELLNISIDDALVSDNPIIKGLAFLDKRIGQRRLRKVMNHELHPLPKRLLEIRIAEDARRIAQTNVN